MTPAICYARFSPRPNAEICESIEKQFERLGGYVVASQYELTGQEHDAGEDKRGRRRGSSGAKVGPGLQRALARVCECKGVLCVTSLDRLTRSVGDADAILKRIEQAGANLAILDLKLDTVNPYHRMVFHIISAVNECARRDVGIRTKRAMRKHQANGRRMTAAMIRPWGKGELVSALPWGWMLDPSDTDLGKDGQPKRIIPNPAEKLAMERSWELYASGMAYNAIARQLDAEGFACRGKKWHHEVVRRICKKARKGA